MKLSFKDRLKFKIGSFIEESLQRSRYAAIKSQIQDFEVKLEVERQKLSKLGLEIVEETENTIKYSYKNAGSITIRKKSSDTNVFEQVFVNKEYDFFIDFFFINNIKPKVIIDGGSNVGFASVKFSEAFPKCKLICIEPDPQNFKQLQLNLANHKNSQLLQKALWFRNEKLYIDFSFRDGEEWSRSVSQNQTSEIAVDGISIQSIINYFEIDYIDFFKIDIEGSEANIFQPENELSFLNKIRVLAIEIHDETNARKRIYDILKEYNFVLLNNNELTIALNMNLL